MNTVKENEMIVKLSKPYCFDETTYTEIDLSGLENLTGADLCAAQRNLSSAGSSSVVPETDYIYTLFLAARAAGLPIEFFQGLSAPDAVFVKNMVSHFLFGKD